MKVLHTFPVDTPQDIFCCHFSWATITLQVLALPLEHTNEYYDPFTSHEYFQKNNNNLNENIMIHSRLVFCLVGFFFFPVLFYLCKYLSLEHREYHKSRSFMLMLTAPPGVLCLRIFCSDTSSMPGMLGGVLEKVEPDSSWRVGKDKRAMDTRSGRQVASKKTVITYKRKKLST